MTLHEQLTAQGIAYKSLRPGTTQRVRCPRCPEEKERRKPSLSLTILADGGAVWLCHRCAFAGGAVNGTRHDWVKAYSRKERAIEKNPLAAAASPNLRRAMASADEEQITNVLRVREQWRNAPQADPTHPYLVRKGIAPTNWRQRGEQLLVPLYREGWGLVDIQYIDHAGAKLFAKGISTRGIFYAAKWLTEGTINLCEGAATAVAIASRTGESTLAAMSRVNLLAVAQMLRRRHPARGLMLWADNDHNTVGNPGKLDATMAALSVHAGLNIPLFSPGSTGTDYLDMWQEKERRA